jgi:hypothetical protein
VGVDRHGDGASACVGKAETLTPTGTSSLAKAVQRSLLFVRKIRIDLLKFGQRLCRLGDFVQYSASSCKQKDSRSSRCNFLEDILNEIVCDAAILNLESIAPIATPIVMPTKGTEKIMPNKMLHRAQSSAPLAAI